jgi:hypothetical protein
MKVWGLDLGKGSIVVHVLAERVVFDLRWCS